MRLIPPAVFVLSACGGSLGSLNPFAPPEPAPIRAADSGEVIQRGDGRALLPTMDQVVPEPALRGLILRARATAPTQGYWGAALVPERGGLPDENGIVTYQFRAVRPDAPDRVGAPATRQLLAAAFVPDTALEDIRGFRIVTVNQTVNLAR